MNAANPELAEAGLKSGQKIKIPTKANANLVTKKETLQLEPKKEVVLKEKQEKGIPLAVTPQTETTIHEVVPSETKFGIFCISSRWEWCSDCYCWKIIFPAGYKWFVLCIW